MEVIIIVLDLSLGLLGIFSFLEVREMRIFSDYN